MRPRSPNFGKPSQCLKAWSVGACACPDTCTHNCLTFRIAFRRTSKSKVGKNILGEKQPAFCSSCSSLLSPQSPKSAGDTCSEWPSSGWVSLCPSRQCCICPVVEETSPAAFCWLLHPSCFWTSRMAPPNRQSLWVVRSILHQTVRVLMTALQNRSWFTQVHRSWWTAPVSKGQLLFFNSSSYFVCVLRELETIITTYIKCLPCARCFIYITLCNSWPEKAPCCFLG